MKIGSVCVGALAAEQAPRRAEHLPGEAGIWLFVLCDMLMFTLLFAVFTYYRGEQIELFSAGQATLNQGYGAINTLLLLTSSWFVVLAIRAAKDRADRVAANFFGLAFACGLGFVIVKYLEYGEKIRASFILTTDDFYMYYYILTGLHFAHVVIGLVLLACIWHKSRKGLDGENDILLLEGGATYWHMVDVLWIILFPLVYLLK